MLPNLSLKVRSAARPVLVVPFALLLLGFGAIVYLGSRFTFCSSPLVYRLGL